jgi:hypothetical protein
MVSAELLIAIALESHADRLRRAEQERIAKRIVAARARDQRPARPRGFVVGVPARRREA